MGRGVGRALTSGLALGSVDRPSKAERRQRGDRLYPSVLEAYHRDSDFKRWQAGQTLHQELAGGWAKLQRRYLLRHLVDDGTTRPWQPITITRFPGGSAAEGAWATCWRHRGALLLPERLSSAAISLDQSSPRASEHRLNLDVSASLSADQLERLKTYIGCQFENGATGPAYPDDLIDSDATVVAFTLVAIDSANGILRFDLSRPFMVQVVAGRRYWSQLPYRRSNPVRWNGDLGRYLISSHQFFCNCPDYSGQTIAVFSAGAPSSQQFPRPSAGQRDGSIWQDRQAGSINRWRQLSARADQRRECKHIHALRQAIGLPFAEPSDYGPSGGLTRQPSSASGATLELYLRQRDLTLDQFIPALAACCSLQLDPRERPSDDTLISRSSDRRWLWTGELPPLTSWCRGGDWWLKRGGSDLQIFDGAAGVFRSRITSGADLLPVLQPSNDHAGAGGTVLP